MGKKRHTQDKLWISSKEHQQDWGGKAIQKYEKAPVTFDLSKLKCDVKLNFSANDQGEFYCPITKKVFNEFSHIIAIHETGNVFSYEAYDELNKKLGCYNDLLTDVPFNPKKIITIQDPKNPDKNLGDIFNTKRKKSDDEGNSSSTMNLTNAQKKLIGKISTMETSIKPETEYQNLKKRQKLVEGYEEEEKKEEAKEVKKLTPKTFVNPLKLSNPKPSDFRLDPKAYIRLKQLEVGNHHKTHTLGLTSSSFTSTSLDPTTKNEFRMKSEDEIRKEYYQLIKSRQLKGTVELLTTLGKLVLSLDCDYAPKTCENFIELCEQKYYNGTIFHRLIPGFMIQGGDPNGNGTGGVSYYGPSFEDEFHPKLSHCRRGVLSMANSGANSNGSQFFITFAPSTHLDGKHSVFGELSGGKEILDIMEAVPVGEHDRPTKKIKIMDTHVRVNPYRDTIAKILQTQFAQEQKQKREQAGGTWTNYKDKGKQSNQNSGSFAIGKYMKNKPSGV